MTQTIPVESLPAATEITDEDVFFLSQNGIPKSALGSVVRGSIVEGAITSAYGSRSEAILSQPGSDVQFITTRAYDSTVDVQRGGARYRKVDATTAALYDARAKLQTANGLNFVLDEDNPTPSMLGGRGGADFDANTGIDEKAVIDALVAYARTEGKECWIDDFYRYHGQFDGFTNDSFRGITSGSQGQGIVFTLNNTQSGLTTLYDNLRCWDMKIWADLIAAKVGGDQGHIGCAARLGNYTSGAATSNIKYDFQRVEFGRTPNTSQTSYKGVAVTIFGAASRGIFRDIEFVGRHSHGLMAHWTGDFNAVGDPVTATTHPNDITIDNLHFGPDVEINMVLSSVGHVGIGRVTSEGAEVVLKIVPGDEGEDFANYAGIGTDITIENIYATGIVGNDNQDEVFEWTSLATSKFRTEEGQAYKRQVGINLHIKNLYLEAAGQLPKAIRSFATIGNVQIDNATVLKFRTAYDGVNSLATTRINFAKTNGEIYVDECDNLYLTGKSDIQDPKAPDRFGVDLIGRRYDQTLATSGGTAFNRGDELITLTSGIARDIERGRRIEIVGTDENNNPITWTTYTTQYVEEGNVNIPVDELPHTFNTGTATIDKAFQNIHVDLVPSGVRTGIQAQGGTFYINGIGPQRVGRFGINLVDEAQCFATGLNIQGNGRGKTTLETLAAYDFWVQGDSFLSISQSTIGADAGNILAVFDINNTSRTQVRNSRIVSATVATGGSAVLDIADSVNADNSVFT